MNRRILNKRGLSPFEQIGAAIIAILVLTIVLLFLFRENINDYLRQLPIYTSGTDKEISVLQDAKIESKFCGEIVGNLVDETGTFSYSKARIYINGQGTNYFWYIRYNTIEDQQWPFNNVVGQVDSDFVIHINSEGASDANLMLIDGASFTTNNKICKTKTT